MAIIEVHENFEEMKIRSNVRFHRLLLMKRIRRDDEIKMF